MGEYFPKMNKEQDHELLVIDNALDHAFYRPVEHWSQAAGVQIRSVHLPAGQALPDVDAASHVILSGSEASIIMREPWAEEEARWIQEAVKAGTKLLGSCWGHQLLAVALAGPDAVQRSHSPEFGWLQLNPASDDPLLPRGDFWCFSSHFDEVRADAHPDLRILATSAGCAVAAMRWGSAAVFGLQTHPEVDPPAGQDFLEGCLTRWPAHSKIFEQGLSGPRQDDGVASGIVSRFLAI